MTVFLSSPMGSISYLSIFYFLHTMVYSMSEKWRLYEAQPTSEAHRSVVRSLPS